MIGLARQATRSLLASPFARGVAVLAGGTAAGQAIAVLASPILTRLYDPAAFGTLAFYTSILSVILVVASLRYEVAIPLARDHEVAANLLALSILIVVLVSASSGVIVWLFGEELTRWSDAQSIRPYLWLIPISLLGGGVYRVLTEWAIRRSAFKRLAQTKLNQGLGMVGTQLVMGLFKAGPVGLLLGWVVGQTGGSGTLGTLAWRLDRDALRSVSLRGLVHVAKRYRHFPLVGSGSALLNSLVLAFPALLLTGGYGLQVAGSYALGQRVVGVPMLLIGGSISQVYAAEASRMVRESPAELPALFRKTGRRLLLVGGLPIVLLALSAPSTFTLVFGPEWYDAGRYLQILTPALVFQFVGSPLGGTLDVLERQDLLLLASAWRLLLLLGVLVATRRFDLSHVGAVALLGVAILVGYLGYVALGWYALVKRRAGVAGEGRR